MKEEYKNIYQRLVKAYYTNSLENELKKIYQEELSQEENPKELLAVLCGIEEPKQDDPRGFCTPNCTSFGFKKG